MAASISASLAVAAPSTAPSSSFCEAKGVSSLKPTTSFFAGKQLTTVSNGSRVNCMQVWPPYDNLKFETLSYLPQLSDEQVVAQVEYIVKKGWIPCLEFDRVGSVYREHFHGSGYYDGRYWTMWKLPMFGCNDSTLVLREIKECQKAYPNCFIRVLGFDRNRQVQVCGFLVQKPT